MDIYRNLADLRQVLLTFLFWAGDANKIVRKSFLNSNIASDFIGLKVTNQSFFSFSYF